MPTLSSLEEPQVVTIVPPLMTNLALWQLYFQWIAYVVIMSLDFDTYCDEGFKYDVSCIERSEAQRGYEDQSGYEMHSVECTDISQWPLSASHLTKHGTSCLNLIMTWINWLDALPSWNLQGNLQSLQFWTMHCRKSIHGFAGHVHINNDAFVMS